MLELKNISKTFSTGFIPKKVTALNSLSLFVNPGEVYAFLGPNGAGKTTTIKIILGIVSANSGSIKINGVDFKDRKSRQNIGYLPDQPYFYDDLTPVEYLKFTGKLYGMSGNEIKQKTEELLELVGLKGKEKQRLRSYSRGMLQRLGMAQALIHDPKLLILDEPMTGLDPVGRKEFRDLILSLKERGKTIFFSSHILADAEMISDRVGILHRGKLVRETELFELQNEKNRSLEIAFQFFSGQDVPANKPPLEIELFDQSGIIHINDQNSVFDAVHWVEESGGTILSISPKRKSLEDIFLEEMKN
ncbi:MAG TPA: ABC transporter ATP-binding protein [Bacteroidetes bacterium]|nr:ABC transporter ATP-binding protein [Bacteroidota bacterium]